MGKKKILTKEDCLNEITKFESLEQWITKSPHSYKMAYAQDWIDECLEFFNLSRETHGESRPRWEKEKCILSALCYSTPIEWRTGNQSAFQSASRNKWLNLCCAHMVLSAPRAATSSRKPKWDKKSCISSALPFKTKGEWASSERGAYAAAIENDWLAECTSHMQSVLGNSEEDILSFIPEHAKKVLGYS